MRQRGKALYTADGQLGYDLEDLADFFAFWFQMQEDGLTPPADLQAQAIANGKMEETMFVTGHALFDFIHSNQLVANQKLVPDELSITMIPNQKDGKPGQYLKPSMLLSMAATAPEPDAAAKLMSFFLTDEAANDILLIERGVSGDASIRERISGALTDTEKKIIDYLDVVGDACQPAAAAAAEERRRARPRAGAGLGIDRLQEGRRAARREGLLRERQGGARARLTETFDRGHDGPRRSDTRRAAPRGVARPLGARRSAPGGATRRLSLSDAVADRLLRPDARADARLALSLLHRLRPADAGALGRARELRIRLLPGPAARQRALGHVPLRALVGAAEARLRAGARDGARPRRARASRVYRAIFYLPSLLGASVAIAMLWRQIFGADGLVNQLLFADARHLRARAGCRIPTMRSGRWSSSRSGSSARR